MSKSFIGVLNRACLKTFDHIMVFEQLEILLDILSLLDSMIPSPQNSGMFYLFCVYLYIFQCLYVVFLYRGPHVRLVV